MSNNYSTARRAACAAYDADKAPAALLALVQADPVVADFLVEAFVAGYAEVAGLAHAEWPGELAALALDATVLDDQDWAPPAGRTWAEVYRAVVKAYRAV